LPSTIVLRHLYHVCSHLIRLLNWLSVQAEHLPYSPHNHHIMVIWICHVSLCFPEQLFLPSVWWLLLCSFDSR
jgi:hypothetical protein